VTARADRARRCLTGVSLAVPAVAGLCGQVSGSLADIGPMATEIRCLRRDLTRARLARANLAAAGRASVAAWRAGEPDPLFYLQDELTAQGYGDLRRPA